MSKQVTIIGGGLAGSECAWQLAERGVQVTLYEMRGAKKEDGTPIQTAVHTTDKLGELVCSNSFRGTDVTKNAVAVLHSELRKLNSVILESAEAHRVPAGGALAMSREEFSQQVTDKIHNHKNITVKREEIIHIPEKGLVVVATGPLTSSALAQDILKLTGESRLSFFDAVAPIINRDSIDMSIAWEQSRYDKGDGKDYINCPMTEEQYNTFIDEILAAESSVGHNPEDADVKYFDGCMPVEEMASRGRETPRFGPMKPTGLTNPHEGAKPKAHAIVQLRQDNKLGTLYNMVGFQTRMKWGEQKRLFRTIPGLENAEFERMGVVHKNTFINSPALLDAQLRVKNAPHIRFAGQVTGVEGYVESTAMGMWAALSIAAELDGVEKELPPMTTMMGALINHITGGANADSFQPMNVTYGLLPKLEVKHKKKERKGLYGERAMKDFDSWI